MWWYRPWYPRFTARRWRRRYWRRRHWWGPRPYFWGTGCGCLPLVFLAGLMVFMCLISMCSAPHYW